MSDKEIWTIKLDWLNIVNLLGLDKIEQISEIKKEKAIKKISKSFDTDVLLEKDPDELDKIVADELREIMKKELTQKAKDQERREREFQSNFIPFKNGGIINIDPRDLKDLDIDIDGDPYDLLKKLAKKFFRGDNDSDDDKDKTKEDNTGYYI
ncbi:MAG: hypothetical protein ACFFBP_14280 [Promethearchaeota archaeon]